MSQIPDPDPAISRRRPRLVAALLLAALALAGIEARWGGDPANARAVNARRGTSPARARRPVPPRPVAAPVVPVDSRSVPEPDPAAPEERGDPAGFRVTRVVHDRTDPDATFAVLQGRAVRAGDRIFGWPVFALTRDEVRLGERGEVVLPVTGEEAR